MKALWKSYFPLVLAASFIVALLVPFPGWVLDILLVVVLGISAWVYLTATKINEWYELKTFPTILLFVGVFRLSLNVSTTRKILTDGDAGQVIEQFGKFVIGGNLFVGILIFFILIVFQFIVANGASRSAEVAARFTLDAMPGKQMAVDSALQSKEIKTLEEAEERRKMIAMEADFYGAMDGAGKFIKGDVIFGITIVFVNIIFGLIVGVVQHGMSLDEALARYTKLTIGDGIVNQIGSLLLSVSSGLVVTRVFDGKETTAPESIYKELMNNGTVVYSLSALFVLIGLFTELPTVPFVGIGLLLGYLGFQYQQKLKKEKEERLQKEMEESRKQSELQGVPGNHLAWEKKKELVLVEIGTDLIPLILNNDKAKNKVELMRRKIANQLGVKVPAIHIQDNVLLKPRGKYVIKIKGAKVAEGVLKRGYLFALKTPHTLSELKAEPAKDPVFQEDGYWIEESMLEKATMENYQILEPLGMMVTHLDVVIKKNLHELLSRQHVKELLDTLEEEYPVLLEEIKEEKVNLSVIQNVLQILLKEGISIYDLPTIVEGILDGKRMYTNIDDIVNVVREKLSKQICEMVTSRDGKIHAIILDEKIEIETEVIADNRKGYFINNWNVEQEAKILKQISEQMKKVSMADRQAVLLIRRSDLRAGLSKLLKRYNKDIPLIAVEELDPDAMIEYAGIITE